MKLSSPPIMSVEQCREKEAECRHMSTIGSLTHVRRLEFVKQADDWALVAMSQKV